MQTLSPSHDSCGCNSGIAESPGGAGLTAGETAHFSMSKSKKRNLDEIYELKQIIKEKDEEIRKLNRLLAKEEKQERKVESLVPKKEIVVPEGECMACRKGKLVYTELGKRTLIHCDFCRERKIINAS